MSRRPINWWRVGAIAFIIFFWVMTIACVWALAQVLEHPDQIGAFFGQIASGFKKAS